VGPALPESTARMLVARALEHLSKAMVDHV
jgi:hypothetical protein